MNKKRLAVFGILLILIASLFVVQSFTNIEKSNKLVNNNIGELRQYEIQDSNIKICLPKNWILRECESNKYISYEAEFKDNETRISGNIKIINSKSDVKTFSDYENKNSTVESIIESAEEFTTSLSSGVKYKIVTDIKKATIYNNYNYYLNLSDDKIIKITFNTKQSDFKDQYEEKYDSIVSAIK